MLFRLVFIPAILLLHACGQGTEPRFFQHGMDTGSRPWTHTSFSETNDDFTFAVIGDLTGGERKGIYSTAVEQLNHLDPAFVVSVGDLIEGGTNNRDTLQNQWESFDSRTRHLEMPFFYLGGNHDLTNPVMRQVWKERYGATYYYFLYRNVLFLMLDSEDFEEQKLLEINREREKAMKIIRGEAPGVFEETPYAQMKESRTGAISQQQTEYFKKVLDSFPDPRWTFVFMHKPLWERDDEKGLGSLEQALASRNYTVINGHLHSYSHRVRNEKDYYVMGTTGGYQNPADSMAFDHLTLVRMKEKPLLTPLKMNGILHENGVAPEILRN
ncbi:metallophosphoesterase family protein [Robertkochia aurantiaca]|uniref:metallophosphoesterase family protein n=1 Tax=Robertkochia aurantiaca TaxID=2873700 RepID=UPI001CCF1058|nr:metallophosphoesterase [Robertkochia sp. 3YJGBD-33]